MGSFKKKDPDSSSHKSGEETPRRRSLYRQCSLPSEFQDDGLPMDQMSGGEVPPPRSRTQSRSSAGGRIRARTPSGKSIRSRTASRADYHRDLKGELEHKVTRNLLFASFLIMFGSSFIFGYNIGVLNQPADLIKKFFNETYIERTGEAPGITLLWSLTTALFLPGGMIGAYSAGFLADKWGRKYATLFSHSFAFIGAILSSLCLVAKAPELLMAGRFFTGINCGFATQLAPMYLAEITPCNLRGAFGTGHQLFITMGILVGSILGLREILGTETGWPYLLLINIGPVLFSLILMPFIPESPRYLMLVKRKRIAAEKSLRWYRQRLDVMSDVEEMETEGGKTAEEEDEKEEEGQDYTMKRLLTTKALLLPLLVACMLQVIQQFSGINAVFFYSVDIYKGANVDSAAIQYAVVGTNAVNVLMTFVAVAVMDKAGRRPLLLYPMIVMVFTLALITASLNLQEKLAWMNYISIFCIILYVVCFAVGLGPIPCMVAAEIFRQGPRPRAMSLAGLTNWVFTFIIALSFPSIQEAAGNYTFMIFLILMIGFTLFVFFCVPETKNRTFEEIANQFQPGGTIEVEEVYDENEVDNVFDEEYDKMMEDPRMKDARNGSVASQEEVKFHLPEEKQALTESMEDVSRA